MAKRKHPAALFEVIHTSPPPPLNLSKARRSWWFGHRSDASRPELLRSVHPSMIADEPHLSAPPAPIAARPNNSPEAELRARFAEAESAHEVAVFSADEPEGLDMSEPRYSPPPRPAPSAVTEYCAGGLRIDRGRQELTFRLNYTTAALVGFIALVLLGLAFVIGKRATEHSDDAAMEALRTSQPDPAVLNVERSDNNGGQARASLSTDSGASAGPQAHAHDSSPAPAGPAAVTGPVQRTIGLDYLVVQSYPSENQKAAQDTADMLTAQGVPCTVEHGLRWAPNWYSVVTVAGFPPHTLDGDKLADQIHKIATDQAKLGHRYRFEPQKYQWNQ
jgi:hypothetical protein